MKLNLSKKALTAGIKAVLPAVPGRPGLPVLTGVRLDRAGDLLSLKATDLELAIEQFVPAGVSVERPGAAVVPAKTLVKALRAMAEEDVTIEVAAGEERPRLHVRSGNRTVTLEAYPVEEWPDFPSLSEAAPFAGAEGSVLAEALERCALCASADETRPILTGVALFFEEGSTSLQVVATDSYRLGVVDVPVAEELSALDRPLLVPARIAKALAKRLKGERGQVRILREDAPEGGEPRVVFAFGDARWWVRTIEGEFPNWRQVMPEPEGGCLDFDAAELESALTAASVVRASSGVPVRLALDRTCALTLAEPDLGTVREELAGATFSPNGTGPLEVAFNPDYLRDGVRFLGDERGRMWVRDALKPALFEGPDRRYAVMPVRTR
jgi:DNA polymerase-3 subunit beta